MASKQVHLQYGQKTVRTSYFLFSKTPQIHIFTAFSHIRLYCNFKEHMTLTEIKKKIKI